VIIYYFVFWFYFVSLYIWLYFLYASVPFCKLRILIVIFSYCYACSVLGIMFYFVVLRIVCV
jgi:hypothetical protein